MVYVRKKRVLLVDDHQVVLGGLRQVVNHRDDFEVVDCVLEGGRALEVLETGVPEIVVTDISMPGMDGRELVSQIREGFPDVKIIVFTMFSDAGHILPLYGLGVSAYVLKERPVTELLFALETVSEGGVFFSDAVRQVIRDHGHPTGSSEDHKDDQPVDIMSKLSRREQEVFPLLANGMSIKTIAHRLSISPKTVESHKYNILNKLDTRSLAELTKMAIKAGLISV